MNHSPFPVNNEHTKMQIKQLHHVFFEIYACLFQQMHQNYVNSIKNHIKNSFSPAIPICSLSNRPIFAQTMSNINKGHCIIVFCLPDLFTQLNTLLFNNIKNHCAPTTLQIGTAINPLGSSFENDRNPFWHAVYFWWVPVVRPLLTNCIINTIEKGNRSKHKLTQAWFGNFRCWLKFKKFHKT
jgi:hypothetical protein